MRFDPILMTNPLSLLPALPPCRAAPACAPPKSQHQAQHQWHQSPPTAPSAALHPRAWAWRNIATAEHPLNAMQSLRVMFPYRDRAALQTTLGAHFGLLKPTSTTCSPLQGAHDEALAHRSQQEYDAFSTPPGTTPRVNSP